MACASPMPRTAGRAASPTPCATSLPVLEIAHAMEQACPDAWFINFTNPMVRICDAIARYSKIKVVGLCHQIFAGYGMVGYVLADELGIDVPAGTDQHPRRPGHLAAAQQHRLPGRREGAHPGGGSEPLHVDAGSARPAHRARISIRCSASAGQPSTPPSSRLTRRVFRRLWPVSDSGRRAPVRVPALAERSGDQAVGEVRSQPL